MTIVYIATAKSHKIMKDAKKRAKNGEDVDWDQVFEEQSKVSAKTKAEVLETAGKRK